MKRLRQRALCYAPHVIAIALASPALGQTVDLPAPPIRSSVDERGVNLIDGGVQISDPQLSIGTSGNGLTHVRSWPGAAGWRHNHMISIESDATNHVNLSLGDSSAGFTYAGGLYTSDQADGSTLTETANTFTYTSGDGTVMNFDKTLGAYNTSYYGAMVAVATSIVRPDGMKKSLTYKRSSFSIDTGFGSVEIFVIRLQSVRSSTGFQLKYTYATNALDSGTVDNWVKVANVRAINGANDYCDPAADACSSFTQSWPVVSYATSASGTDTIETVADPENRVRRYVTNGAGKLTGVRRPSSPSSNNITYGYDGNGRVSSVAVSGVGTWNYTFTPGSGTMSASVTTPTVPTPRYVTSNTTIQQPTSITDENGQTTQYAYHSTGRLQQVTQPEGNYTTYAYDGRGNLTSTVAFPKSGSGLSTLTTSATYSSTCSNPATCNKPITTTDTAGNVTNYYYNANGTLDYVQAPAPSSGAPRPETHYTYWTGQAWFKVNSNSVTLAPDTWTVPIRTTTCITGSWPCATSNQRVSEIDYIGGPSATNMLVGATRIKRGDGSESATTGYGYDAFGNVTNVTDAMGQTTIIEYAADRQLTGIRSPAPDGSPTGQRRAVVTHYNGDGLPDSKTIATVNWDGSGFAPWQYTFPVYDSAGRLIAERVTDNTGATIYSTKQWSYNGAGRLDCETVRVNSANFASPPAACTQGTGSKDRITRYIWEYAGALDRAQSGYGTGLQRDEVAYTRWANGTLRTMTDAKGNVTSYAYDGHDRQLRECYNASPTACVGGSASDFVQLTYDGAGRLTNRSLRGHSLGITIGFTYDNLGRLKVVSYPGGGFYDSPVTYTYDNLGQMLRADDTNTHSATFAYDALGRVTSQGDAISARTMLYDANGRRTRLTWPDGRYVTYQYNATGEMTAILESGSTTLASFGYDGIGRRTSLTRGNGVVTNYSYDAASRLTCLTHNLASGGTLNCTPTATGHDQATTFAYNPAGQITSRTVANDAYAWAGSYNVSRNYTTNALNQYTASGAVVPTYDVKGNLASAGGTATYAYSTKNELVSRNDTGVGFYHDPLGRLDSVLNAPGGGYGFQYDGAQISNEISTASGTPILRRYVYGPNADEPIVWYEGADFSNKRYLVADERGSIVAVTNTSGGAIAINSYDEYGIPGTTNTGRFQYTGQAWMSELGMYSYKARIYSPTLGRFLQTDPAGYPDGPNWYNYVNADPVNARDSSGMYGDITVIGSIVASVDMWSNFIFSNIYVGSGLGGFGGGVTGGYDAIGGGDAPENSDSNTIVVTAKNARVSVTNVSSIINISAGGPLPSIPGVAEAANAAPQSDDDIVVTARRQRLKFGDDPDNFRVGQHDYWRDLWESAFGPDNPDAAKRDEAIRRRMRQYCNGNSTAGDATDLAGAAADLAEKSKGRFGSLRRGAGRGQLGRIIAQEAICSRNGYR